MPQAAFLKKKEKEKRVPGSGTASVRLSPAAGGGCVWAPALRSFKLGARGHTYRGQAGPPPGSRPREAAPRRENAGPHGSPPPRRSAPGRGSPRPAPPEQGPARQPPRPVPSVRPSVSPQPPPRSHRRGMCARRAPQTQ